QDFAEAASRHATYRIAMFTPSARRDIAPDIMALFTGYSVKPSRATSLAARSSAPGAASVPESPEDNESTTEPSDIVAPHAVSSRALSISAAEDNEINASSIRSLLTRMGHRPVITTDGEQALESWLAADGAGTPYDVVLMDIQSPKSDG
ncbi:hypothetical protein OY671_012567, partial [Metschnikowia pulcherrima]